MESLLHILLSNAIVATGLAVIAVVVGRLARKPALTHGLWVLVLLKLVTPPLVFVPVPWPAEDPVVGAKNMGTTPAEGESPRLAVHVVLADGVDASDKPAEGILLTLPAQPVPHDEGPADFDSLASAPTLAATATGPNWLLLAGGCWLFGSVAWLVLAASRARRFHSVLQFARPAPHGLQREIARLAKLLGLSRPPAAWLVPGAVSPMLWGLSGVPRLLLPSDLLSRLTAEQRATVLVHELAHFRRRDHWVRWLELLVTGLFWWHPVVWWARRELHEAEELCCDAWVVWALPDAGRSYATALVECLDFLSHARPLPIGASGVGRIDDLKRRLTMILGGTTPRRLTWVGGVLLLGLGALLPVLPTRADDDQNRPPVQKIDPKDIEKIREHVEQLRKALGERADDKADPKDIETARTRVEQLRKALEFYRAVDRPAEPKADPKEIDQAKADVEKLKKELEERAKGVQQVEARLREAAERLAKLQGHQGVRYRVIVVGDGDGKPVPGLPGIPGKDGVFRIERPLDFTIPVNPPGGKRTIVPFPPQGGGDQRYQDLERKLEAIMRELQELKRQLPPGGPGRPGGGAGPRPDDRFRPAPGGGPGPRPEDGRSVAPRPGSGGDREQPRSRPDEGGAKPRPEEGARPDRKPELRFDGSRIEIEFDRSKSLPERKPDNR